MRKRTAYQAGLEIDRIVNGRDLDAAFKRYEAARRRTGLVGLALADATDPNWTAGGRPGDGETVEWFDERTARLLKWCEENGR